MRPVTTSMHIVWFKRDLRIYDHAALIQAHSQGVIIPLYIFEPELWAEPDMSHRQFIFLRQSLQELNAALTQLGQPLVIRIGNAVDIIGELIQSHSVQSLWSHQETWNDWTYQRDLKVKHYLKTRGIIWHEPRQNGAIRRLKDRHDWANQWYYFMNQPLALPPKNLTAITISSDFLPLPAEFQLLPDGCRYPQKGGRTMGLQLLKSFLQQRGEFYQTQMSSPLTAFDACSRLSPHLAFGTVSMREVFQALHYRLTHPDHAIYGHPFNWQRSLKSFQSRLFWHCHFMQKLESEPEIEYNNMHSSYNDLHRDGRESLKYQAWATGHTGYPFIDACMRALIATGWINFRMRAMLMSFASYHLWLDWRHTAIYLATLFTDYEPGIHYSQCQMQSGTTGINTLRIYNPIKQSQDQDPEGLFIRRWLPELNAVPTAFIHQPWLSPDHIDYPHPIIDEKQARASAIQANRDLRNHPDHKDQKAKVLAKHANPRRPFDRHSNKVSQKSGKAIKKLIVTDTQTGFDFI